MKHPFNYLSEIVRKEIHENGQAELVGDHLAQILEAAMKWTPDYYENDLLVGFAGALSPDFRHDLWLALERSHSTKE